MWIKRQSPVRCRGTRSCNSVDSVLSVWNEVFTWDGKKFVLKHVKINHGITVLQHLIDPRQNGIGLESRSTSKTRYFSSIASVRTGWKVVSDSGECYCHLRNVQDLLADKKTRYERRFGEPFKGPLIPFGAMVECHPISPRDLSRIHQFGKKVLPGIFLGYELVAGGNLERRYSDSRSGRFGKSWMHQIFISEESTRKKFWSDKKMMNSFSHLQIVQQNCQEETTESENPL